MKKENSKGRVREDGNRREPKKSYKPPELIKWGSIKELTRGATAGFEDGFGAGTQPF